MLDGFKRYSFAINGDQFPGLALVFHKSKDQLSGLTPTELHLELTNKENYSLWEVSELSVYNIAKFSRKWGPSGLWGGGTDFWIDVTECEDLVYLLSAEVEDLVDTMASQHAALAASKTPPAPDSRAQKKRLAALESDLREAVALQAARDLAYVRLAMDLHRAKGGADEDFVSPLPGVAWSAEPSTSSQASAVPLAGGSGAGSPKPVGVKSKGGTPLDSPTPSTPTSPSAGSRLLPIDAAAAQAQLIDERITAALVRLLRGPGEIPGFPLAAMHTAPGFSPTITVNTGTNSELKK
jgi:hypothetical protein